MTDTGYPEGSTALLFIDPWNDLLAEEGKIWPLVREVARSVDLHANLARVRAAVREAGIPIFILPTTDTSRRISRDGRIRRPFQLGAHAARLFAADGWGGEWCEGFRAESGDIVVKEHWSGSSFANTDLDVQLRQHGITHVILIGLITNTRLETSGRYASELGYHVTLVRDATASCSAEAMHAAHEIDGPTYGRRVA